MAYGEQAVLIAPGKDIRYYPPIPGDDPCTFTLENNTGQVIAFSLFIVPLWMVGAARFPWRDFVVEIRKPGGLQHVLNAIVKRFSQLPPHDDDGAR